MSGLIRMVHEKIIDLSKGIDHTVDNWFLMKSPMTLLSIIGVYLLFVLKIGPALMANRKPFNLNRTLVAYNAFQVLFSTWLCYVSFMQSNVLSHLMSSKCEQERDRESSLQLYSGAWFYFFSKIVDFLDTIFFVLRKKQSQVSFLHVYHHSVTALFSWGYLKYAPGEQGVIIGIVNSFVHIIMYFYYMMSAMGPQYQKYLWWKKYITRIQLIQFVLIVAYMVMVAAKDCKMSKTLTFFFVVNGTIFLYMFGNFYRKTYKSKDKKLQNDVADNAKNSLIVQGDDMKRLITDANNNTVKFVKQE